MLKPGWIAVTCIIIFTYSCTSDKIETDPCAEVSYFQTIKPLVNLKCAVTGCHISGFQPGDFTNYEILKKKVSEGKIQKVVFELSIMPPTNKLTETEYAVFKCWVKNGAKYN